MTSYKRFTLVPQTDMDLLKEMGLKPHHKVLDIGCGGGRLGNDLISYLDKGNYYGFDKEAHWVEKFRLDVTLNALSHKEPVIDTGDFTLNYKDVEFDFVYGYSVFSHVDITVIKQFFNNFNNNIKNAKVVVTGYFNLPEGETEQRGDRHVRSNEYVRVKYNPKYLDKCLNEIGYTVTSTNLNDVYDLTLNKIGPGTDEGTFITGGNNDNQMVILIEAKK